MVSHKGASSDKTTVAMATLPSNWRCLVNKLHNNRTISSIHRGIPCNACRSQQRIMSPYFRTSKHSHSTKLVHRKEDDMFPILSRSRRRISIQPHSKNHIAIVRRSISIPRLSRPERVLHSYPRWVRCQRWQWRRRRQWRGWDFLSFSCLFLIDYKISDVGPF